MGKPLRKHNNGAEGIKRQTKANIAAAVIYQLTAAVCSLILPRFVLLYFGSDVNGMLQSISQLLTYTMIMEFGIGGLVTASFYKPLAMNDREAVSDIFNNAKSYFNKVSFAYVVLVALLAVGAKAVIKTDFDFWYVSLMVLILGANYYFSYYFAIAHRLLIRADQKIRIIQGVQSITLILNAVICVAAIKLGVGIHGVKAISALVFLINPLVFRLYVKRNYNIGSSIFDKDRDLPRKRDGMVHHIAFFIHMNTDIVLLSIFSGTKEVSVYSVYNSVIYAIENFFATISESICAALGNLIAKDEKDTLKSSFELYRTVNTAAASFVCIAEAVLIIPFVSIYTKGVTDVHYIRPAFAYIMIAAQWFYCVRLPYNNIINAAGHYRQTKIGAYIEVILNMSISIATVSRLGLVGVALGTLIAMAARTVYMAWYLSKNILYRGLGLFAKDILLNFGFSLTITCVLINIFRISADSLVLWAAYAALICVIIIPSILVFNLIVNRKTAVAIINGLRKR